MSVHPHVLAMVPGWQVCFDVVRLHAIADGFEEAGEDGEAAKWRRRVKWFGDLWSQFSAVANGAEGFGQVSNYGLICVEFWRTPKCVRVRLCSPDGRLMGYPARFWYGKYLRLSPFSQYALWLRCWNLMVDIDSTDDRLNRAPLYPL